GRPPSNHVITITAFKTILPPLSIQIMSTIQPFLWFNNQAEEAANFYVSTFKNSKILGVYKYAEGAPQPAGSVMTVSFSLNGMPFIALNGGPHFKFSEAISFLISAETQDEIDEL